MRSIWFKLVSAVLGALLVCAPASAQRFVHPPGFRTQDIAANGTTLHVRTGGTGPAVVLLHGYGETGDMWAPLAGNLSRDHTVIVPDLRGMGLSAPASAGFEKMNQAEDIAGVMDALQTPKAIVVAHDIGNMVAFSLSATHPDRVTRLVLMDAPIPGVGPWEDILKNPLLWHFRFGGPDMERLVLGRERIYLDRFWNEFSADPAKFDEESRSHYAALYARPGNMKAGFSQFAAFDQDAIDNRAILAERGKLTMPVLAIGGEHSFGPMMAAAMSSAAEDVQELVIPDSGHWLMEEQPAASIAAIRSFIDTKSQSASTRTGAVRLSQAETETLARGGAGAGTSGVAGIQTTVLYGDPARPGPYAIEIRVPPSTRIAAHTHRDARTGTVVSGTWFFGYNTKAEGSPVKQLTQGAFYTEPGGVAHFAFTRAEPATVRITGIGPSDTIHAEAKAPRRRR